jgi:hypothetical protein
MGITVPLQAIENLKAVLKPRSGSVILRDYASGDLAQQRLACEGRHKRLAPDFYVRGDGTRCLYFHKVSFSIPAATPLGSLV